MKWGQSDVACERRSVGPGESPRFRRPFVLRLLRLPKVAPQACVRGDLAPGRTSTRRRAVSRLQRRVRVRRCRHRRPLAAPAGPARPEGIAPAAVRGLGLGGPAVLMALLYGVVQTGFPEELLFRGLIAGSLSRRLPVPWANLGQALLFLIPHLLVLWVM